MKIFAFADEASSRVDGQIRAMARNGLNGVEIRGVDGQTVSDITVEKAREVLGKLKDHGLSVWSVGSPIGKIDIRDGDHAAHLDRFRRTLEIAGELECPRMRMFSYYIPRDAKPEQYRSAVIDRLTELVEIARPYQVALCHENEKGIYGDIASRCVDLLDAVPELKCIFDPANFIQSGQDIPEAWAMLGARTTYLHIKDAMPDGRVVPAGKGIGHLPEILRDFVARGGESVTVEPHLQVFDGLAALEKDQKSAIPEGMYATSDDAFDAACGALKDILKTMEG